MDVAKQFHMLLKTTVAQHKNKNPAERNILCFDSRCS